jgi:hypothetical protein
VNGREFTIYASSGSPPRSCVTGVSPRGIPFMTYVRLHLMSWRLRFRKKSLPTDSRRAGCGHRKSSGWGRLEYSGVQSSDHARASRTARTNALASPKRSSGLGARARSTSPSIPGAIDGRWADGGAGNSRRRARMSRARKALSERGVGKGKLPVIIRYRITPTAYKSPVAGK